VLRIAVFVSGRGSNFQAVHKAVLEGRLDAEIRLLVSSRPDAGALDYATRHAIPVFIEDGRERAMPRYGDRLLSVLLSYGVDFIALCGYLKLVPGEVVGAFRARIVNIHPALLPAFGGRGMYGMRVHEAAIRRGVKYTGVTVHFVTEAYDEGQIVAQRVVEVADDDTPESLAAKVLTVEHSIYPETLQLFAEDSIAEDGKRKRIIN